MISENAVFASFCFLLAFWLLASPSYAAQGPYEEGPRGLQVLTLDLAQDPNREDLAQLRAFLEKEESRSQTRRPRLKNIIFTQGLIEMASGNYLAAIEKLRSIPADHPLKDMALYYEAQSQRKIGFESISKGFRAKAENPCFQARVLLNQLEDYLPGPYTEDLPQEYALASACYAKALLARDNRDRAYPILKSLIESAPSYLSENDQEFVIAHFANLHWQKGYRQEAEIFAKEQVSKFPRNAELRKLEKLSRKHGSEVNKRSRSRRVPVDLPRGSVPPEVDHYEKARKFERSGQNGLAVKEYVKLISKHPGSHEAKDSAKRLKKIGKRLVRNGELPTYYVNPLRGLPPRYLYPLTRTIWEWNQDDVAKTLFEAYLKKDDYSEKAAAVHYFLGRLEENKRNWRRARPHFLAVIEKFSASKFSDEALFKLGFLAYLEGRNKEAQIRLENYVAEQGQTATSTRGLFWLARTYEKLREPRKARHYQSLIPKLGPVSYYAAITGQFPKTSSRHENSKNATSLAGNFWDTYYLERARTFLNVGLPHAARSSLKKIQKAIRKPIAQEVAALSHYASNHRMAIWMTNEIVNRHGHEKALPRTWLNSLFPQPRDLTSPLAANQALVNPLVALSLIKQESAFIPKAESRVGALGLMQLMPNTAKHVARQMGISVPSKSQLLLSRENIKLGTRYLAGLLDRFDGNLIYALGSYNAGPHRVRDWKARWNMMSPEEFVEIIPFAETRGYVKAVIRNYFFYTHLSENRQLRMKDVQQISKP